VPLGEGIPLVRKRKIEVFS